MSVRVTWDEDVTGFDAADIDLTNGVLSGWNLTGRSATFVVTPNADGEVVVRVPMGAVQDLAGNASLGATPLRVVFDRTRPGVTLSAPAADPTNASSVTITATFTEAVTGLALADFTSNNATLSNLTGSGTTWSLEASPTADGLFSLRLPADQVADAAGNTNTASALLERTSDRTATADLTYSGPGTVGGPITLALELSDPAALTPADFAVVNGAVTLTGGPRSWTVQLTPTTDGTASVRLKAGAFTDAAGNVSTASPLVSVTHDATRPGVSVSSAAGDPTNDDPIEFTLTFTEPVTGLAVGDLDVTGGTATLTGSGRVYTVAVTPSGDGPVSVAVPAGVAADGVGHTNTAGAAQTRTFDGTAPSADVSTTVTSPTNAGTIPITVTWTEPVSGFDVADVEVTGGTVSGWTAAGGRTWTFDVSPNADGEIVVRVPAGGVRDAAGNPSRAATPLRIVVDTVRPGVRLTSPVTDPTNAATVPVTVTFDKPVTGLALADFVTDNAAVSNLTGSGVTWTVTLTPAAEGRFSLSLPAGSARDGAGNTNTASNEFVRVLDRTATATLTRTGPALVNGPFTGTLTLSDDATVTAADFAVTGATVALSGGPRVWTVAVTPTVQGAVSVQLKAGAFTDAAGNTSSASQVITATHDSVRPGVSVTSTAPDPTRVSPIEFTLTFTEPVTGLTVDELTVTGGTATLTGTGATRTVSVVPTSDGVVSLRVPGGVAVDAAGNTNTASTVTSRTFDSTRPTPLISTSATNPTNATTIPVEVTWDEDVTGFAAGDVTVTNGTLSGWSMTGRVARFDVTPQGDGDLVVALAAGVATDPAGNPSRAAADLRLRVDRTRPTVALTTTASSPSNRASVRVTATFSETVTGFTLADLVLVNATASGLTGSAGTYTFDVAPDAEGTVRVSVAADAVTDAAGNTSRASTPLEFVHDTTATARLTYTGPALVNSSIGAELVLSDDAVITPSDFTVTNGTVTLSGGPRRYDVVLTPTADGTSSLQLPAGAFTDAAGNASTASGQIEVTYDGTAPRVTGLVLPPWPTAPFTAEVSFSEDVTGLDAGLIAVVNGAVSDVAGSGRTWTFTVTPATDGPVAVTIDAGAALDAAGNPNPAHGPATTTYDTTAPTVALSSPSRPVVTTSPIPVEVLFSEAVTGFDLDDLEATNATVTNLSGGGDRWTVDLVPAGEGEVTLAVRASAAKDSAGHESLASTTLTREFDSTRPTLALTTTAESVTKAATVPVTARFSKAVLGFTASDLETVNARVAAFTQVDARTWTFDLVAESDGAVSVTVAEGAAASAGGHLAFGGSLGVVVDTVAPVLTLTAPANASAPGPVVFDLTASEPVTGLDEADLAISGTAKPTTLGLTQVSATRWQVSVSGMSANGTVELAVRDQAVTDAAGHHSAPTRASVRWRTAATELTSFRLLQERGVRRFNQVTIPVRVNGPDNVRFTVRSSNRKLLPASAIRVTGQGDRRQLALLGRPKASGRSRVVVTARAGSVTKRIRFTFISGTRRADRIVGTPGIDVILARGGNDVVRGLGGADHLYGGYGSDRLVGGPGRDVLVGGAGRNILVGGAGGDLFVAARRDTIRDLKRAQGDRVVRPPKRDRRLYAE